ncbi:hypothetical protein [Pseudoflavonifractor phocaeensis]|uniref:hypothetical protein n=1 Tax=Pseudoflavonifractor phocaeensis TaxID=1870988 RepID=UPI001956A11E|nr:hypothetical protein [Pseudoflavonifractor phocaeensis]MBM6924789.1 hypothetical protein [Pseudoflavonifractor phocaeensis]
MKQAVIAPEGRELQQLRRVAQLFAAQLTPAQALEIAWVYPEFAPGMCYETGTYLRRGVNALGDPQLYQVTLDHLSAADRPPESAPELYEPLGLARDGTPLWSRPAGDLDGYQPGDVVHWAGRPYRCLVPDCLTCPEADPVGWTGL